MKKKMTINYIFNLAYQILIIILPLITTPYVSRILGPDGIGAYSYTASITTYFILFGCIGLNLYGQREVAYHQSDKIAISKTFFEILLLKIGTMAISICVFIFTVQMMNQYKLLIYIQLLDLIANMLDITYFYQGIEEFKVIVIRNVLIKIIGIICIFTFVKTKVDLSLYVFIYSGTLLLGNLSMWLTINKHITRVPFKELKIIKQDEKTKERLEGVEFQILDSNKKIIYTNLKTDNKGEIYISNLIPGTYYLKETNTKDGYIIQENLIEFAVKLNQKLTITVNNSLEEKPEINIEEKEMEATVIKKLPKTGM